MFEHHPFTCQSINVRGLAHLIAVAAEDARFEIIADDHQNIANRWLLFRNDAGDGQRRQRHEETETSQQSF
jgi:hypothetical protein